MSAQDIISTIAEKLGGTAQVNSVFGEPRVIGSKTIIPTHAAHRWQVVSILPSAPEAPLVHAK